MKKGVEGKEVKVDGVKIRNDKLEKNFGKGRLRGILKLREKIEKK